MSNAGRKQRHQMAIRERAREALLNLYHNATPNYPRLPDDDAERFNVWFQDYAEQEIDYLQGGGAHCNNYRKTLEHPANAGKLKSERARRYYVARGMREMEEERADCGMLTGWKVLERAAGNKKLVRALMRAEQKHGPLSRHNAQWERISEYGKLYRYGRGGRTLAPDDLMTGRDNIREDYAQEMPIAAVVDFIRVIESFNDYVERWNQGIAKEWEYQERERQREERSERAKRSNAKRAECRERKYWEARDVVTR